jgi:hypothetical protein
MTPEEKQAKFSEIYAKALAICGDKADAQRRAKAGVECVEWRANHDRFHAEMMRQFNKVTK